MKCNAGIKTMREMTKKLNTEEAIANLAFISESEGLQEKPDWQTINNYLERLDPAELGSIESDMIRKLIRTKDYADYTLDGRYIVVIDGTDFAYFQEKHCEHDLVTKKTNPETGEVRYEYYHKVLEAKILLGPGLVLSIGCEFIENEDENVSKQDCEINAGYRLLKKIKKEYPRLQIVIVADALYAVMPFMKAVRNCGWDYIFRVKEGRQEKLMEDFEDLLSHMENDESVHDICNGEKGSGSFANGVDQITGKKQVCNMIRYEKEKDGKTVEFNWVTDIEVTRKNLSSMVRTGRMRWKIENEGFNIEKNGIYDLEHLCSRNYNAMKNHYILIQIAYTLMQLYIAYDKIVNRLKEGMKYVAEELYISFRQRILGDRELEYIRKRTAMHLCCLLAQ